MDKITRTIRRITIAPVLACIMLVVLRVCRRDIFQNEGQFVYSIFFLTIVPILAYPLQKHLPYFQEQGRDGQRQLALIFAFLGCLGECLVNTATHVSKGLTLVGGTYLLSGLILLLLNRTFHFSASGHAAGVSAAGVVPIALGVHWIAIPTVVVLVLVYFSSLYMRRHTFSQLLGGTLIPIFSVLAFV